MTKFRDVVNYLCATGEWQIENENEFYETSERLKRKDNFKLYLRVEKDRLRGSNVERGSDAEGTSASTRLGASTSARLSIGASSASKKITIYAR